MVGSSPAWSNPALSTTIESTIFLIDQNLNRPTFDKAAYAGAIQETAPANTFVNSIFFVVEDKDRVGGWFLSAGVVGGWLLSAGVIVLVW